MPTFRGSDRGKNLVGADVPEMQVRRKLAGGASLKVGAAFVVAGEATLDEGLQLGKASDGTTTFTGGRHRGIDGQRFQVELLPGDQRWRQIGPPLFELGRQCWRRLQPAPFEGIRGRPFEQVGHQGFLQVSPEIDGAAEGALGRINRIKPIAVDLLEPHLQTGPGGRHHPRQEKTGEFVGDDQRRPFGEFFEQAPAFPLLALQVGVIKGGAAGELAGVVRHAVQHETVQPLAGPGIGEAQGFEYQQTFAQLLRAVFGVFERKVRRHPALGDHPVEDVVAIRAQRGEVDGANTQAGYGHVCLFAAVRRLDLGIGPVRGSGW